MKDNSDIKRTEDFALQSSGSAPHATAVVKRTGDFCERKSFGSERGFAESQRSAGRGRQAARDCYWIDKTERMPTAEDADEYGCVLIYDILNGIMISGYKNTLNINRWPVTHWARMPEGPGRTEGSRFSGD